MFKHFYNTVSRFPVGPGKKKLSNHPKITTVYSFCVGKVLVSLPNENIQFYPLKINIPLTENNYPLPHILTFELLRVVNPTLTQVFKVI